MIVFGFPGTVVISTGAEVRVGVVTGAKRGILAVGDSGPLPLMPLGLRGLLDRSSDVVEMVTPTRPLSLSTSAFRFVPARSLSFSFSFSFSLSLSFFFSLVKSDCLLVDLGSLDDDWTVIDRSALNADAILGPAAVAAARQLGGDDSGFSMTFFSVSLLAVTGGGGGGAVSFSVSSSLALLPLELPLEPDSPSSESPSEDEDVLKRLSRCSRPLLLDCCCWSTFFFGPRLIVAASLSRLCKKKTIIVNGTT